MYCLPIVYMVPKECSEVGITKDPHIFEITDLRLYQINLSLF